MRSFFHAAMLIAAFAPTATAAQWTAAPTGTGAEFRGIHAAGEAVWAAGAGGTFARSTDGGMSWTTDSIAGAGQLFLVDVHAIDASTAYILGTHFEGGLARIYKTVDGGATWMLQLELDDAGTFFDGLAFWDERAGIAFGDPVGGGLAVVVTTDGGQNWRRVPDTALPPPLPGEAGFAASGTAVTTAGPGSAWIGTGGGATARVYATHDRGATWSVADTPLPARATAGIFGIGFRDGRNGIAVGGDYQQPTADAPNVLVSADGGATWSLAGATRPAGVRYGVTVVPGTTVVMAVGPSGSGFSRDFGRSWTPIDTVHVNTVFFTSPESGWAAGPDGRILRWTGAPLR
jgi:photosystem II stability/assembly factor-like uncharacterized protein